MAVVGTVVPTAGVAAAATTGWDQNIPIYSLTNNSLGLSVQNGAVVLAPVGTSPAGRWNVTELDPNNYYTDHTYTHVATGKCLSAQSRLDGLVLVLATCNANDTKQHWAWSADRLWNAYTDNCMFTEQNAAGARLYMDTCVDNQRNKFSDKLRVKLSAVSGDNQTLTRGQTGSPMTVRITDEYGTPLSGFKLEIELRGQACCEPGSWLPSPVRFSGGSLKASLVSNSSGLATTPAPVARTDASGRFFAIVDPRAHLYGDLYVLQDAGLDGTVN